MTFLEQFLSLVIKKLHFFKNNFFGKIIILFLVAPRLNFSLSLFFLTKKFKKRLLLHLLYTLLTARKIKTKIIHCCVLAKNFHPFVTFWTLFYTQKSLMDAFCVFVFEKSKMGKKCGEISWGHFKERERGEGGG